MPETEQADRLRAQQSEAFRSLWADKEHVPLLGDYNYVVLTEAELEPAFAAFHDLMWGGDRDCDVDMALSEAERAAGARLAGRLAGAFHLHLGIYERDRFIGWCWGRQESSEEFHMVNAALLPEHRGRGVYTALLRAVMGRVQAEGFQLIYSWHQPDNPGILVPKLKAGFVISGFRVWDQFGLLVQLTYAFNDTRRELFRYRIGRAPLSERLAPLLK
jgi:GNAT superfamily N-acetyltransferase